MKNIIRNEFQKGNYTRITNDILQSKNLKPDEIGLLVRLLSLPAEFKIDKSTFWKTCNVGRDQFKKTWKQLSLLGYIETICLIDEKSKTFSYRHIIYEVPKVDDPYTGNQSTDKDNPYTGNQLLETSYWKPVNIKKNNKKEPIKNIESMGDFPVPKTGGNPQGPEILDQNTGPDSKQKIGNPNENDFGPEILDHNTGTSGKQKIDNPNENQVPEFLKNGIIVNGKIIYPEKTGLITGQLTQMERKDMIFEGYEIIKIINKEISRIEKLYKLNKDNITKSAVLSQQVKDKLSALDYLELINELNNLKLSKNQKNLLRPNTKIIRQCFDDIPYYQKLIKKIKLNYGIN